MSSSADITDILLDARKRDPAEAYERLLPLVYDELKRLAHGQLRRRRPGQTLETTALVHEAYLKLIDQKRASFNDRGHFLAVAATAMRHILINYARSRTAQKRGGDERPVTLDEAWMAADAAPSGDDGAVEVLALDRALQALSQVSERLGRLVELRYFGGLTVEETAAVLDVSAPTVKRDWRKARAFLYRELRSGASCASNTR